MYLDGSYVRGSEANDFLLVTHSMKGRHHCFESEPRALGYLGPRAAKQRSDVHQEEKADRGIGDCKRALWKSWAVTTPPRCVLWKVRRVASVSDRIPSPQTASAVPTATVKIVQLKMLDKHNVLRTLGKVPEISVAWLAMGGTGSHFAMPG